MPLQGLWRPAVALRRIHSRRSRERLEEIVGWLEAQEAAGLEHGELEAQLQSAGQELVCCLFQDHVDLRALRERRLPRVADDRGRGASGG